MHRIPFIAAAFIAMFSFSSAQPLPVGAMAPGVSGITDTGESLNLDELYQKQPYTLVYFYPKADTSGCTAQACSLRDAYEDLLEKGVAIVGVSTDDVAAQRAFREKYNLPFRLIADTDKTVMTAFGQDESRPKASRQAYLVHEGRIVYADHNGSTKQQADDILQFLARNS